MEPTPNIRGRHASWWVVGVGLAFVVVVAMALQVARQRAEDQRENVVTALEAITIPAITDPEIDSREGQRESGTDLSSLYELPYRRRRTSGGNFHQAWNQYDWQGHVFTLVVRQERAFFGSNIEARISGSVPKQIDAARAILAVVDVDLVVEP